MDWILEDAKKWSRTAVTSSGHCHFPPEGAPPGLEGSPDSLDILSERTGKS